MHDMDDEYSRFNAENALGQPVVSGTPYRLNAADLECLAKAQLPDEELAVQKIRRQSVLNLTVTSGEVAMFDPLWQVSDWFNPLDRSVPVGKHPVDLFIVEAGVWGERNALLRVTLADGNVVSWVPAVLKSSPYDKKGGHIVGVDAGTLGLADTQSLRKLQQHIAQRIADGEIEDESDHVEEMNEAYDLVSQNYQVDADTDHNMICVGTGIGDGGYPIYWGLGSSSEPILLVASFYLFEAAHRKSIGE